MKYSTVYVILVAIISHSTASNESNSVASDVLDPTASCTSNPICFDNHYSTSNVPDSTAPNNVFKLTAAKASNVTTSVFNLAASNISVEVSNSECNASSLISNTFEGEFADLEVPTQLPSHIQLNAVDASMIIL